MRTVLIILGIIATPNPAALAQQLDLSTPDLRPLAPTVAPQEMADSSDLRKEARDAQNRFERRRSRLAHMTWGGGWGYCDERVGRFCLRFTEGSWTPKPEVPEVVEERDRLVETLYSVNGAIPGDPWVRGQLVWYLAESGRVDEARGVAAACPPHVGWWCPAFRGLAAHISADYPTSEEYFDDALSMADPEDREAWTDVRELLDRDARKWLERQEDGSGEGNPLGHDEALRRFWLLADPFYMISGNERKTEHYARWLVARLRERARNAYGVSWGDDLRELLVRYGWEIGWERTRPRTGHMESGNMIGHQHPDAVQFAPPGRLLENPLSMAPGAWVLEAKRPRSTFAPAFAAGVDSLPTVYARFPRGDSVLVVVAYDASWGDTLKAKVEPSEEGEMPAAVDTNPLVREQGVFAVPLPGLPGMEGPEPFADRGAPTVRADPAERLEPLKGTPVDTAVGTWTLTVPRGAWMVSAESLIREADRGARARFGVEATGVLPGVPIMSDLLLMELEGPMPAGLDQALSTSKPLIRVLGESRIRVIWEVSGLGSRPEALHYSLALERMDRGLFRRAARALRIVGEDETDLLTWTEAARADQPRIFRSIDLDLPPLDHGEYRLVLSLRLEGRTDMTVERRFRVLE